MIKVELKARITLYMRLSVLVLETTATSAVVVVYYSPVGVLKLNRIVKRSRSIHTYDCTTLPLLYQSLRCSTAL